METGAFIVNLVQTVVFMAPLVMLFYRQGKKDQALDELVKDVNGQGKKIAEIRDGQSQALIELKAQIDNMNATLVRLTTLMDVANKSIEEIKRR